MIRTIQPVLFGICAARMLAHLGNLLSKPEFLSLHTLTAHRLVLAGIRPHVGTVNGNHTQTDMLRLLCNPDDLYKHRFEIRQMILLYMPGYLLRADYIFWQLDYGPPHPVKLYRYFSLQPTPTHYQLISSNASLL